MRTPNRPSRAAVAMAIGLVASIAAPAAGAFAQNVEKSTDPATGKSIVPIRPQRPSPAAPNAANARPMVESPRHSGGIRIIRYGVIGRVYDAQ